MPKAESDTITRRSIIAAGAALPLANASTQGEVALDAGLVELGKQFDAAWAQERALVAKYGYQEGTGIDEQFEASSQRCHDIARAIEQMPAHTIDGLRVKAKVVSWCHNGDIPVIQGGRQTTDVRVAQGIIHDLLKIG